MFEVPFTRLMDGSELRYLRIRRRDVEHTTWQIAHEGLVIWGITANLTPALLRTGAQGRDGAVIPKAAAQRLKNASVAETARDAAHLCAARWAQQDKTRAVGGVVRDSLLERNRDSAEIDFATQLLPDAVMRRAGEAGIGVYPTGIDHGTVTLKLGDVTAEVTTLRQDIETDGRHAKVKFGTDWTA